MDARLSRKSPRRSLLFTPGNNIRKMRKVADVGADTVILDLEDAVAVSQKEEARQNVVAALSSMEFGQTERLVRVNSLNTDMFTADMEAVATANLDGIVLPKAETAQQVQHIDHTIAANELKSGRPAGAIRLFALIETALGVMNIKEICQSSQRLDALLYGAEDLAAELGATRSPAGWEIFYGRAAVVTAAAAYDLEAIDTVYVDLDNLADLEKDALFARQLGYSGKMAVHPRQVEVLNRVFSPAEDEIARAERLISAYQSQVAAGSGVFALDGHMVDKPRVRAAEHLLERARLCRLMDE